MVTVASATDRDVPAIAALLEEMDRFYGVTEFEPPDVREGQIRTMLFGARPVTTVDLASVDGQVAGLASYSFLWPAVGLTHSLFLKELYVAEAHRRAGIGQALMRRLTDVAREQRCSRVEWMTDEPNRNAQAFYASLGFEVDHGKLFYRVTLP